MPFINSKIKTEIHSYVSNDFMIRRLKKAGFLGDWDDIYKGPYETGEQGKFMHRGKFMIDLMNLRNDGDGVQYALLESIQYGVVPIVSEGWCVSPLQFFEVFKADRNPEGVGQLINSAFDSGKYQDMAMENYE